MAAAGFGSALRLTPTSSMEDTLEERPNLERRRASVPSLFTFGSVELGEVPEDEDGLPTMVDSTPTDSRAKDERGLGGTVEPEVSAKEIERDDEEGKRADVGDIGKITVAGIDLDR